MVGSSTYVPNLQVDSLNLSPTIQLTLDEYDNITTINTVTNVVQSAVPQMTMTINNGYTTPSSLPIGGNSMYGCFLVFVCGVDGNASAQFLLSKSSQSQAGGSVFKMTSARGSTGEELDMVWPANSTPCVYHSSVASVPVVVTYTIKYFGTN